jgi:UDP-N-acetylmuramoyl-L-alanyl-D-glutamate--2,6-diaminopimelate ligase
VQNIDYTKYADIAYDSRKIVKNSIFVAIKGVNLDGHSYIQNALELGASLIVLDENEYQSNKEHYDKLFSQYVIDFETHHDTRLKLAEIANIFYGRPSEQLCLIGVTGTNGKTTVTHLIQNLLTSCAILGTMGLRKTLNSSYLDQGNTTPQNKEVQRIIKNIVESEFKYLAMEVSSHALEQYRVAFLNFKYAIVTNLTQDHLDYHKTMDKYFSAKAKIFEQTKEFAILNADDKYFNDFKALAEKKELKIISVSTKNSDADLYASNIEYDFYGLSYNLKVKDIGEIHIETKLNSEFNIYNSMFAIAVAINEGIDLDIIKNIFANIEIVPGRFQTIKTASSPLCIIDYAHSPDGLVNVLKGAKVLTSKESKLICVFGCGGDRDITKRPIMGKIAYDYADQVYITSDNPRSEDPERIVADILTGIPDLKKTKVIIDRKEAITTAIQEAQSQDIIVIAGKGHENYQILAQETIHFDDKEEVEKILSRL